MDDLDLLRAVRPSDPYPHERSRAARARLLTAAAEANATAPAGPARSTPARSTHRRRWQGSVAVGAALASAAAAIVISQPGTRPHPAGDARSVLMHAIDAARHTALPSGARWVVTENRITSTASSSATCIVLGLSLTGTQAINLSGLARSCPAQPPAELLGAALASPLPLGSGDTGFPDPATLPDQPGRLIAAIYRWYRADYSKNADRLPGQQPPPLTTAGLREGAFGVLTLMLARGVTTPSPASQLGALALIPGTSVDAGAHDALGRAGIAVVMTEGPAAARETTTAMQEDIFDPKTYQIIGTTLAHPALSGAKSAVTITSSTIWRAYYDTSGRQL